VAIDLRKLAEAHAAEKVAEVERPAAGKLITLRVSSSLVAELNAAAAREGTTRKVMITRALAQAGYGVAQIDLEDRSRRRRREAA
jgi:predicted HicB family RNase H-like nuclease